jgi:hypothetical protein
MSRGIELNRPKQLRTETKKDFIQRLLESIFDGAIAITIAVRSVGVAHLKFVFPEARWATFSRASPAARTGSQNVKTGSQECQKGLHSGSD